MNSNLINNISTKSKYCLFKTFLETTKHSKKPKNCPKSPKLETISNKENQGIEANFPEDSFKRPLPRISNRNRHSLSNVNSINQIQEQKEDIDNDSEFARLLDINITTELNLPLISNSNNLNNNYNENGN